MSPFSSYTWVIPTLYPINPNGMATSQFSDFSFRVSEFEFRCSGKSVSLHNPEKPNTEPRSETAIMRGQEFSSTVGRMRRHREPCCFLAPRLRCEEIWRM